MMEDRDIERLAGRLGDDAGRRLEVERVTAGVLARLRAEGTREPRRNWWRPQVLLRVAAALAVLAAGGLVARRMLENPAPSLAVVLPAPMLRDLTDDELVEVFDSLGVEAPVQEGLAVGLEGLNEAQLKELLSLMEG